MRFEQFPILLDDDLTRIGALAILTGTILIRIAHWGTVGWVLVALGLLTLLLAYLVASAAECDEVRIG
jgi:hypothetical protein